VTAQAGESALCRSLVETGTVGYCDLIGILEVGRSRAEMGLVRSCVHEPRSKFLGRIKKQCENLRRLLLLWFEGPSTRCCDSIPCPRARFPDEGR
jgi:hypothetical protein